MFCSNCGSEIEKKYKFCPKCGEKLEINNEEDSEIVKGMIRMLFFDSEGEFGLLVLEGTKVTDDEELLKFVNAKIIDDDEGIYVQIDE